jgi:soluble cytochrome b562
MKITIEEFWTRFQEKSERLMDLDSLNEQEKEELLNSVDEDLKQYSEGLSLEIGKLGTNGRKLTLTADGDVDYFEDLINLYEQSPILDFWDIVAFRQGKGANVNITFEQVRAKIEDMTSLTDEQTKEALDKVSDIESVVNGEGSKKSKWEKIKPVLAWLADKSFDLAMTILPLLLKMQ